MWFKVDDRFPRHPKTRAAARTLGGKHALGRVIGFWTEAGTFCCEFLTDGFVSDAQVADLQSDGDPDAVAAALVAGALWRRLEGGYQFHEWDHYQPSAAGVREKRERDRQRKSTGKPSSHGARGLLVESTAILDGVVVESGALPERLAAESEGSRDVSEALARARSRSRPDPCPSDKSRAEEQAARRRRPAPARLQLSIWQVRPNIHAAVHALLREGAPYVDATGRPDDEAIFERTRQIVARDLKATYDTSRELQSIVDSALGQYRSEREAGMALESFRRGERQVLKVRVRQIKRLG